MKEIKGYEGLYSVTECGRVWSHISEIFLKGEIDIDGYIRAHLYKDKKSKHKKVHRLVAEAFLPEVKGKEIINHKDSDRTNNHLSNLEWSTYSENNKHAHDYGFHTQKGDKNNGAKLNVPKVKIIKLLLEDGRLFQREIASFFEVSKGAVNGIKRGINWKDI